MRRCPAVLATTQRNVQDNWAWLAAQPGLPRGEELCQFMADRPLLLIRSLTTADWQIKMAAMKRAGIESPKALDKYLRPLRCAPRTLATALAFWRAAHPGGAPPKPTKLETLCARGDEKVLIAAGLPVNSMNLQV